MTTKRDLLRGGAAAALAAIVSPLPALAASGRPGFFSAKDIAEAGYIYGLPIVMNYGVMYEFVIDKTSSQYKAPFNTIANEARVFTYKDTAVVTPNSDTPYSMLWLDLRAEPMVISVPAVDPKRYYSVQLSDGNTYNYGYIGSRATGSEAGDYLVVGPGWNGQQARRHPQGLPVHHRLRPDHLPHPALRCRRHGQREEGAGRLQGAAAVGLSGPARACGAPEVTFPIFTKDLAKTNFFEFLDFALQFAPAQPNEAWIREQLAKIGVGPGKTFNFKDLPRRGQGRNPARPGRGQAQGGRSGQERRRGHQWLAGVRAFGDADFFHGDWLRGPRRRRPASTATTRSRPCIR